MRAASSWACRPCPSAPTTSSCTQRASSAPSSRQPARPFRPALPGYVGRLCVVCSCPMQRVGLASALLAANVPLRSGCRHVSLCGCCSVISWSTCECRHAWWRGCCGRSPQQRFSGLRDYLELITCLKSVHLVVHEHGPTRPTVAANTRRSPCAALLSLLGCRAPARRSLMLYTARAGPAPPSR